MSTHSYIFSSFAIHYTKMGYDLDSYDTKIIIYVFVEGHSKIFLCKAIGQN